MPTEKPDYGSIAGRTAIARRSVSVPTRELIASGRIPRSATVLNHGRGKAESDANALAQTAAAYAEYDPNYASDRAVLDQRYDVVVSNYVLNVLPPDIRKLAWEDIAMATGGVAYITVRSTGDKTIHGKKYKDGVITATGTFQKPYTATGLVREAKKYFDKVEVIMGRQGGSFWTIAASEPKVRGPGEPREVKEQTKARLGSVESDVLRALREHGSWHPHAVWMWDTPGRTKKIMDSLVRKGFARIEEGGAMWLGSLVDTYVPVETENSIQEELIEIRRLAGIEAG